MREDGYMAGSGSSPLRPRKRTTATLLLAASFVLSVTLVGCGADIPDDWTAEVGPCKSIEELQSEFELGTGDVPAVSPRADLIYYCGFMAAPSCAEYSSGGELTQTDSGFVVRYLGDNSELEASTTEDCRGSFAVWAAERFEFSDDQPIVFLGETR